MSGKDVLASTFVSVILMSVVGFVALPAVYPALQNNAPTTPTDVDTDLGKVIQIKHVESSSQAGITDDNINTWVKIPDSELNITVSANSILDVTFTSPYIFGIGPGPNNERFIFNVSLGIVGVGNQSIVLSSWNSGTISSNYEYSSTLTIHYISPTLAAGSYTINVYYISSHKDASYLAYLTLSVPALNHTRSLSVLEMR